MIKNIILILIITIGVFLGNYGFNYYQKEYDYYENVYLLNKEKNNNSLAEENFELKIKYLKSVVQNEEYVNKNINWDSFTIDGKKEDYDIIGNNPTSTLLLIIKDKDSIFHDGVIKRIRDI